MYKVLLCWRYLLTRYLALACIISIMLGVGTLIVVNSVMSGFSTKLKERLHGLLSDVLVESLNVDGFSNPEEKMERIRKSPIGDKVVAMNPAIEILGLVQMRYQGQMLPPRPVHLIGVDPKGRAQVGGFAEHLLNPKNRENPSFDLTPEAKYYHRLNYPPPPTFVDAPAATDLGQPPPIDPPPSVVTQPHGVILGNAIASFRGADANAAMKFKDRYIVQPGDEVIVTTVSGQRLAPVYDSFVVCDFFKSEMSEYDSNYVFVPLEHLQRLRATPNRVTHIQIKLKDYREVREVVAGLMQIFPESAYKVETWEDKQGPLLAAIAVERGILNVLLFLIVGVAGFGILAIFAMIVVEKTRDIGILKALGAPNLGVMNIFLSYGLLLGVVGAGFGTMLGLGLTININEIEQFLTRSTGQELFPRGIYYFDSIPTHIQPWSVAIVNGGAILVAVLASVLPSLRAAMLHPVRALRYE